MFRVLIIGGYGNFGRFITRSLADQSDIHLIIAGRSLDKARQLLQTLPEERPHEAAAVDINQGFPQALERLQPDLVIHTSGPFQKQGYEVALACIASGVHYVDLADGRDFVAGINKLDLLARSNGVLVVSGASSVPCLTSAVVDYFQPRFSQLEKLEYGITTAQKTARGLATTTAVLGYTGQPITTLVDGKHTTLYGWQSTRVHRYSGLGWRLLGNCDVPDLALFPDRYPSLQTIHFRAGLELPFVHLGLWGLSWLVRIGLINDPSRFASVLLRMADLFNYFGSDASAFHACLTGKDALGMDKRVKFELLAQAGDGPFIPCMPAILLTRKLAANQITERGAQACIGLITLREYLTALDAMAITHNLGAMAD